MSLSWTGAGTGGLGRPGLGAETVQDRFLICITRPHHTSATSTDIWSSGKRRGGRGRNTQCSDEREILKKSKTSSSENARLTGEAPSCATLTYRCRCWWWSELRSPKKGGNPTRRWPKIQSSEKPSLANLRLGRILETRGEIEKKEEKV